MAIRRKNYAQELEMLDTHLTQLGQAAKNSVQKAVTAYITRDRELAHEQRFFLPDVTELAFQAVEWREPFSNLHTIFCTHQAFLVAQLLSIF